MCCWCAPAISRSSPATATASATCAKCPASASIASSGDIAAVATDTNAVEVIPFEDPTTPLPLHMLCIRDVGLTLGEMFYLEDLAADCANDGAWQFFFSAPALKVTGGVGSPLNPLAIK